MYFEDITLKAEQKGFNEERWWDLNEWYDPQCKIIKMGELELSWYVMQSSTYILKMIIMTLKCVLLGIGSLVVRAAHSLLRAPVGKLGSRKLGSMDKKKLMSFVVGVCMCDSICVEH